MRKVKAKRVPAPHRTEKWWKYRQQFPALECYFPPLSFFSSFISFFPGVIVEISIRHQRDVAVKNVPDKATLGDARWMSSFLCMFHPTLPTGTRQRWDQLLHCLCVCRFPSVEESLSIGRTHPLIIIAVRYYTSWFSLCERERDLARPLKEGQEEFTSLKLFTNRRGEDEKSGSGSKAEENTHITTLRPSDGKRPAGQQTHWRLVGPYFTPSSIGENKIWNSKGKK